MYDATIGQYVTTTNITVVGAGGGSEGSQSQKTPMGPYTKNNIFSATLQAGHEYVALLLAEGTATDILGTAQTDGHNLPTFYANWGTFTVRY